MHVLQITNGSRLTLAQALAAQPNLTAATIAQQIVPGYHPLSALSAGAVLNTSNASISQSLVPTTPDQLTVVYAGGNTAQVDL